MIAATPETETITQLPSPAVNGDFAHFQADSRGWTKLASSFLAVLTLALVGLQYALTIVHANFNDPDIWWHLRDAQYLIQHHHFVRQDTYSFTVAGHPWVNTEWLSEIPYYLAYRALGLSGVQGLTFLLPAVLMLLLLYLCYQESHNFKASIVACALASFLVVVSYGPRTILFGYVLVVLLLIVLQRFRARGTAPLWVLPPLFWLWANTHGSWALGLILFFLVAVAGLVGGSWGRIESTRWTPSQMRQLAWTGAASVAALFANPYGWRLVYYPFDLAFKQKLNIARIEEWASVNFQDPRGHVVFLLITGLFVATLVRSRRLKLGELLTLLFASYVALEHIRFLALLGIVVAPILSKLLDFFPRYKPELETPRLNAAVLVLGLAAMVYFWPRETKLQESLAKGYPTGVLSYLKANPPQGNVLNDYLWGGFLDWNIPEMKVFIDSRVDIFEYAGVFGDYLDLLGSDSLVRRLDPIMRKYQIRYVLFALEDSKNPKPGDSGMIYLLEHDPRWKVLYQDKVCVLLQRIPY